MTPAGRNSVVPYFETSQTNTSKRKQKARIAGSLTASDGSAGASSISISSRTVASSPKRLNENPVMMEWRRIALNTCQILKSKALNINGKMIGLTDMIERCIVSTIFYDAMDDIKLQLHPKFSYFYTCTDIHVTQETSLEACRRIYKLNGKKGVACLNFASAVDPGGMFRDGTNTQEDSLARSSALYVSLSSDTGKQMYVYNRQWQSRHRGLHSDAIIYSPEVPVFKDDRGNPEEPYLISFITSPAVERALCKGISEQTIQETMQIRARKILSVAVNNGVKHLILGAWGCGIFDHDASAIAQLFSDLLAEDDFQEKFVTVTFPVTDSNLLQVFKRHFPEE